ncbi:MAG: hypothetical protein ACM3ZA_08040 [Bacillota bacterium]
MLWKYLLAALAGAGVVWLWQARRRFRLRLPRLGRAPAARAGEEFETVVEELVSAAEQLMDDLGQRQRDLQALLREADERIASLRQGRDSGAPVSEEAPPAVFAPEPPVVAVAPAGPSEETIQAAAAAVAAARLEQAAWNAAPQANQAVDAAASVPSADKPRTTRARSSAGRSGRSAKSAGTGSKSPTTATRAAGTAGSARSTARKPSSRTSAAPAVRAVPSSARAASPAAKAEPRHQDVLSLAQRGLGPAEIARQTGRTTGEVQLILGLNRNLH